MAERPQLDHATAKLTEALDQPKSFANLGGNGGS